MCSHTLAVLLIKVTFQAVLDEILHFFRLSICSCLEYFLVVVCVFFLLLVSSTGISHADMVSVDLLVELHTEVCTVPLQDLYTAGCRRVGNFFFGSRIQDRRAA